MAYRTTYIYIGNPFDLPRRLVLDNVLKDLGQNVNLKFLITEDESNANIVIRIRYIEKSKSVVGRNKDGRPTYITIKDYTDNDKSSYKTIMHEFLHALGFGHEHQHPQCPIKFKQEIIESNSRNYATLIDNKYIAPLPYDPISIMHYHIKRNQATNIWFSTPTNYKLSDIDIRTLRYVYGNGSLEIPRSGNWFFKCFSR